MEFLPPEVLVILTEPLCAQDVARLWLCGCKALQWRLGEAGGVQKFDYTIELSAGALWPRLVSEFRRLTHFSMKSPALARFVCVKGVDFSMLPPTVTSIHTNFMFDAFWLKTAFEKDAAQFANLRSLDVSGYDRDEQRGFSSIDKIKPWRMGDFSLILPQSLNYLRMDTAAQHKFALVTAPLLPPGLETLELVSEHFPFGAVPGSSVNAPLPHTLTSLSIRCHDEFIGTWSWLQDLPRCLQTLVIHCPNWKPEITVEDLLTLPQLTRLLAPFEPMEKKHFRALPRSLLYLAITKHVPSLNSAPKLPPSLLEWSQGALPPIITPDFAMKLPSTLTRIGIAILNTAVPLMPSLTSAMIRRKDGTNYELPGRYLKDLRHLSMVLPDDFVATVQDFWPSKLVSLQLFTANTNVALIQSLPPTLENLELKTKTNVPQYFPSLLRYLPPQLKSFKTGWPVTLDWEDASVLPSTLETLAVGRMTLDKPARLRMLPSGLRDLSFECETLELDMVLNLPRGLTRLMVTPNRASDPKILYKLPPRLLAFLVKGPVDGRTLVSEDVSHLPKSLTALEFGSTNKLGVYQIPWPPHFHRLADPRVGSVSSFITLSAQRLPDERPEKIKTSSGPSYIKKK